MKILFVHGALSSFTDVDLQILRSTHVVRELHVRRDNPLHLIAGLARSVPGAGWADLVFSWFGSYHALVPFLVARLLGRRCVVIASGYDVANVPEIDHGNMRPGLRRQVGLLVFHLAHRVLAVSRFAAQEAISNAKVSPTRIRTLYHGVAVPVDLPARRFEAKRREVLTVSNVNQANLPRKGLTTFVQAAHYLPEVPFVLVGPWQDGAIHSLRSNAPANVEFAGPLYDAGLQERMLAAAVYVQVSAYESFGMALAEAMACGCVPVVTQRGALPEVVGDTGFFVPYGDPRATAEAIRQALQAGPEAARLVRERILTTFPLEKRRQGLLSALQEL